MISAARASLTPRPAPARRGLSLLLLLALLLLSECRRDPPPPEESALPPASLASTTAPVLHSPPGAVGEWVESKRYRLRVVDVRLCEDTPERVVPGAVIPGRVRVGVSVEIESKDSEAVFVSPQAAALEKDGKLFQALTHPAPTPACAAPLGPRRLARAESTRGVLVFEAPDAAYLRSSVLRFKPPRWGRELRVDVQLPDQLM